MSSKPVKSERDRPTRRYVTIWRKLSDGSWMELFATGALPATTSGTSLALRPLEESLSTAGDVGATCGTYELRAEGPGERPARRGRYVTIRTRARDGSWRTGVALASPGEPLPAR